VARSRWLNVTIWPFTPFCRPSGPPASRQNDELCAYEVWIFRAKRVNQLRAPVAQSHPTRATIGHGFSQCSEPTTPSIAGGLALSLRDRAAPRALARSPSINVIFLAFGEGPPAASLWPLRVRLKGASDELDQTCGAKWRSNCASANLAGSGAHGLAASTAAFARAHATARDLVGPSARRRRTERSGPRAADLGAPHPPALDRQT
jgi:hypothetical protein